MLVFTQLSAVGADVDCIRSADANALNDIRWEIFRAICSAYYDQTSGSEDGVYDSPDDIDEVVRFGKDAPVEFTMKAVNWNDDIRKAFHKALQVVLAQAEKAGEYPLDTLDTHALQNATCELNNHWSSRAEHGIYADNGCGYPYFKCTMTTETIKSIVGHPEEWALVEIYVK